MLTREELGQRIARERQRAGLTQEQLASALGLERTAITRIEQGRQGVDTLQLSAIAQAVGRPPAIFLESDEVRSLEVLLRAPDARSEDVRQHLEWLAEFVRDYEFLLDLASEVQPK